MLSVNMKQFKAISPAIIDSDNVRVYDNIVKFNGKLLSVDYKPYIEFLMANNVFFTLKDRV